MKAWISLLVAWGAREDLWLKFCGGGGTVGGSDNLANMRLDGKGGAKGHTKVVCLGRGETMVLSTESVQCSSGKP